MQDLTEFFLLQPQGEVGPARPVAAKLVNPFWVLYVKTIASRRFNDRFFCVELQRDVLQSVCQIVQ